ARITLGEIVIVSACQPGRESASDGGYHREYIGAEAAEDQHQADDVYPNASHLQSSGLPDKFPRFTSIPDRLILQAEHGIHSLLLRRRCGVYRLHSLRDHRVICFRWREPQL